MLLVLNCHDFLWHNHLVKHEPNIAPQLMVNLNHSRCTAREKITELPQFKRTDYNIGAKHLQKHSSDLSIIQGFSVLL